MNDEAVSTSLAMRSSVDVGAMSGMVES